MITTGINFLSPVNVLNRLNAGQEAFFLPGTGFDGSQTLYEIHNKINGILTGPEWVGRAGTSGFSALRFDGTDDYVETVASRRLDIGGNDKFSLAGWFRPDSATTNRSGVSLTESGQGSITFDKAIGVNSSGRGFAYWFDGATRTINGTTSILDGRWHFVVAAYDGTTMRLYVDGRLEGSFGPTTTFDFTTPQLVFSFQRNTGLAASTFEYYDGLIGPFFVYSRALNLSEIASLYFESLVGFPNVLNRVQIQPFLRIVPPVGPACITDVHLAVPSISAVNLAVPSVSAVNLAVPNVSAVHLEACE